MLNDEWCSLCLKAPASGVAIVDDPNNGLIDLPLCLECVKILTPPGERYALGIE